MTFAERVRERRTELGLSQAELGRLAGGVPQSTIGQIENGRNKSTTKILELANALQTSVEYLLHGKEEKGVKARASQNLPQSVSVGDTIRIERIDMAGACGNGAVASDWPSLINSIEFPADAVRRLFAGRDTRGLRLVDTFGDSMEPTIPELSAILIDTRTDSFVGDGIYFFAYAGELYTKRLQKTPAGLIALSDNPLYQPFTIDEDDRFRIIGKYYGVISLKLAIA